MKTVIAAMALLVTLTACARHRPSEGPELAERPHIDAVRPDSILLPRGGFVDVAIVGAGFVPGTPGTNTIEFAGATIAHVAADAAGKTIRFAVPDMIARGGESPPAQLEAGSYSIRIRTAAGASNAMTVRVYR